MFQTSALTLIQAQPTVATGQSGVGDQPMRIALQKYRSVRSRAGLAAIWSLLTGRTRRLLDLDAVRVACDVRGAHYAGTRTVSLRRIRGSEGRSEDFDADFNPVKAHNKWRWLNIAAARQKGAALPLVDLVQVGDAYFVRDGHHRISVARAWGQESIDAEVTVWEVEGPLPTELVTTVVCSR